MAIAALLFGYGFRLNLSPSLPHQLYFAMPASSAERGNMVAFSLPQSQATFAKRVAGVGGDVLEIKEGKIVINGHCECGLGCRPELTYTPSCIIPEGFLFALGASDDSFDSRYEIFGLVPVSAVKEILCPIY
jgi:conjugative transfer signal peptidase TraF